MTRYKYHRTPNAFEELPGMQEPNKYLSQKGGIINEFYPGQLERYRAYLSTLHDGKHKPMIPGSPECREVFSDGQIVGDEIEIAGADEWKWAATLEGKRFIRPVLPPIEDELLKIWEYAQGCSHFFKFEEWFKQQYHLTRK